MGTWDDGLFDNDSALDLIGDLLDAIDSDRDPAHFAAALGIRLWFDHSVGADPDEFREFVRSHPEWSADWAPEVQGLIQRVAGDPEGAVEPATRSREVLAVTGSYTAGRRYDEVLELDGVAEVLRGLANECATQLDAVAEPDLYEVAGDLAPLGILLELCEFDRGLTPSKERVQTWRSRFEAADSATTEEREFWDVYVSRVRGGFSLLEEWSAS